MDELGEYSPLQKHLVFVYGTLKKGFVNHSRLLLNPLTKFVAETQTAHPCFWMDVKYCIGDYVAPIVGDGGDHHVLGEVYEVIGTTLRILDQAEGHPWLYRRCAASIVGFEAPCWMYLFVADRQSSGPVREQFVANRGRVLEFLNN